MAPMTKITETVTDRLRELEPLTRPLEPDARERAAMTRDVTAHAEGFLSWMDGAPGYVSESVPAKALSSAPIGAQPIEVAPDDAKRDDAGAFVDHLGDA